MGNAQASAGEHACISSTVPWCSGLAYVPVKDEIAGSNPVGTASVNCRGEQRRRLRLRTTEAIVPLEIRIRLNTDQTMRFRCSLHAQPRRRSAFTGPCDAGRFESSARAPRECPPAQDSAQPFPIDHQAPEAAPDRAVP